MNNVLCFQTAPVKFEAFQSPTGHDGGSFSGTGGQGSAEQAAGSSGNTYIQSPLSKTGGVVTGRQYLNTVKRH